MSYNRELVDSLIELGEFLKLRNYSPGYSGNVSVRNGSSILITTSGSANGFLTEDCFVEIDFEGSPVDASKKPSSEKMLHVEMYKTRSDVNCVIHVHSPALSAFAAAGKDLMEPVLIENVCYFGGIPLADYALPSSKELVTETAKFFEDYSVILMKNHGVIVGGESIQDAYLKLEMAEEYAKTIIYANQLGGVNPLSVTQVKALDELMGR